MRKVERRVAKNRLKKGTERVPKQLIPLNLGLGEENNVGPLECRIRA